YNTVTNNNYGIRCKDSSGNIIYHNNNIGNTQNANDDGTNTWHNSTLQQGNYWNDYTGEDSDGDGIGDTPYNIPGNSNQDEYPLMTEYGPPHADFTHTIDDKNVSFDASRSYDYDGTIVSYEWDFDDNATGTGLLINHTYSEDGIYNVTLTVTDDDNKNDSTVKMVIVDSIPPEITDNTPSVGYTGDPFTFNATVTDNVQVYEVIAAYRYENGPVLNIDLNNTDGDYWEATIIIERTLEKIYYQIFAWDFSDNENHTDLKNITIMDNDLPEITDVIADPEVQMIDGYVNISAVVTDNIAVDEVYLYIRYPDSSVKNFSITGNKIGDMYYSNRAYDQAGVHTFHIWASDTSGNSNISEDNTFEIVLGVPPEIPQIRGPTEVKKDTPNPYEFSSTDPDGDDVYYWIEWGDDDTEEWIGPYGSGEVITVNHTWSEKGDYEIRAKAKDTKGLESDWGYLTVTVPKNQQSQSESSSSIKIIQAVKTTTKITSR
ncbi:MAG: PKD domain-containing protein, partial [Thermoplasmatales archaeon]